MTLIWILSQLSAFMKDYNYCNLTKSNTCYKSDGSCIDLILTNRKYYFKNTSSFETGISEHHRLIYSMLKRTFEKKESEKVTCRNYKQFQWENFEKDLTSSLRNCNGEYENYERKCLILTPRKKVKTLRGNHKRFITKILERLSWKGQSWKIRLMDHRILSILPIAKSNAT